MRDASSYKVVEAMEQRHRMDYVMRRCPPSHAAEHPTLAKQGPELFTAFSAENTNPGVFARIAPTSTKSFAKITGIDFVRIRHATADSELTMVLGDRP